MTNFVASILVSLALFTSVQQINGGDLAPAPVVVAKTGTGVVYEA